MGDGNVTPKKGHRAPEGANGRSSRVRRHQWLAVIGMAARTRRARVGLLLTLAVVGIALVGPLFSPYSATEFVTGAFASPSRHVLLGGDVLGRDVLSRVLDGGWLLLAMATVATIIGVALGATAGIAAAYYRGWWDGSIMRVVDVVLAFPQIVFVLLLVSIAGPSRWLLVLAVAITHAPQVARVLRSAALDICERDYIRAVELMKIPRRTIIWREILPNLSTPLMVDAGLRLTWSIVLIAGLSFIGFGLQPPSPSWGLMLNENRIGIVSNAWAVIVPAALIALLTVGLNTFTDAVARVYIGVDRPTDTENLVPDGYSYGGAL